MRGAWRPVRSICARRRRLQARCESVPGAKSRSCCPRGVYSIGPVAMVPAGFRLEFAPFDPGLWAQIRRWGIILMNAKSSKALRSGACGVAGPAAMAVILALCLPVAAPAAGAEGNEKSGKEVVNAECASCHATGVEGAPRIGDRQVWSQLASHGLSSLTAHALNGIRKMPAHGGHPNLTDLEITRAITYMVNQSGGKWVEPISRESPPAARTGEEIVKAQCSKCHQAGVGGAPRIGDRDAWIPRLKQGLDTLVQSAIRGHGGMPARGGMANLTDSELKDAVIYLFRGPVSPGKP